MKQLFSIPLLFLFIVSCKNKDANHDAIARKAQADTSNYTTIQWIDTVVNFGTIKQGEKITVKFKCKNTGNKPLVLTNVHPGCGCTVADYTKEPIVPGAMGEVSGAFNSQNFCGVVNKVIIAESNTNNDKHRDLKFTGTIIECKSTDREVKPHPVQEQQDKKRS